MLIKKGNQAMSKGQIVFGGLLIIVVLFVICLAVFGWCNLGSEWQYAETEWTNGVSSICLIGILNLDPIEHGRLARAIITLGGRREDTVKVDTTWQATYLGIMSSGLVKHHDGKIFILLRRRAPQNNLLGIIWKWFCRLEVKGHRELRYKDEWTHQLSSGGEEDKIPRDLFFIIPSIFINSYPPFN